MATQRTTQLQVRIDTQTKQAAKEILAEIGMDTSTAVNILFRQIARTGSFPIDLRDVNGFSQVRAKELRSAVKEARESSTVYTTSKALLHDLHTH